MSVEYACVFSVLHTHESRIAQGQILMLASMWESFPTFNFSSSFFFSYVLMEVPLFEMLIQFNKVKRDENAEKTTKNFLNFLSFAFLAWYNSF